MTGTIESVNEKGFGFIKQEGVEGNVFFHKTALVDVTFEDLKVGDAVSFEVEQAEKGPRAINVQRA
jgi:CspA family cold shock protein